MPVNGLSKEAGGGGRVETLPGMGRRLLRLDLSGGGGPTAGVDLTLTMRCGHQEFTIGPTRVESDMTEHLLPAAAQYRVTRVVLDGWVSDQEFDDITSPSSTPLHLSLIRPSSVEVIILAGSEDRGVDQAWVQRLHPSVVSGESYLPAGNPKAETLRCPGGVIHLPASARASQWLVGADGFATQLEHVAPSPVRRVVRLLPGGALEATCRGVDPSDVEVLARCTDEGAFAHNCILELSAAPAKDGLVVARAIGLAAGTWEVLVRPKSRDRGAQGYLGMAEVEILGNAMAHVDIDCLPHPLRGRLNCEIVLPDSWTEAQTHCALSGVGASPGLELGTADVTEVGRKLKCTFEGVPAGSWDLFLYPCGWASRIVTLGADHVVMLRLRSPAELRMRLRDAHDEQAIADASLAFACRQEIAEDSGLVREKAEDVDVAAEYDVGLGEYVAMLPPGRVDLYIRAAGRVDERRRVWVRGGALTRVTHEMVSGATIDLSVVRAGKLDVAAEGWVAATHREHGMELSVEVVSGRATFDGLVPGTYDVAWQPKDGREERVEVELHAGQALQLTMQAR